MQRDVTFQVLAGVRIAFTGLIPLEQPAGTHALWRMAKSFGASCTQALDVGVTHVVAKARGTEKVFWALQHGKHVVSKAWCAFSARRTHNYGWTVCSSLHARNLTSAYAFWLRKELWHAKYGCSMLLRRAADAREEVRAAQPYILRKATSTQTPVGRLECSCTLWKRAREDSFQLPP